ncbi:hypothetical protein [Mobiluncus curtisii]|uniref:hypothetical protein n=1 Tax=Mobiluncus curtisii TaxID=2051 RepID=UPI00242F4DEC|nr:hypothetical protein [Mobiluncus curtisii]
MRIAPVHEVGDEVRSRVVRLPAGRGASGHTALPCTPCQRTHRAAVYATPPDLGP